MTWHWWIVGILLVALGFGGGTLVTREDASRPDAPAALTAGQAAADDAVPDGTSPLRDAASREFTGGVMVRWRPAADSNELLADVLVGGDLVSRQVLAGDATGTVRASGDNWSVAGRLATVFDAEGRHGQLTANLRWSVAGSSHRYRGVVGSW